MKVALVGLPKSGKSTVFTAVTGTKVDPYAAPEPRQAVVRVPDERLARLAKLCDPKKITEAQIEFVDVPGCSLDDPHGQAEWRRLMPTVRMADLLVLVVRDFENATVPAHKNRVDAKSDFDEVWQELLFADLDTVTNRVEKLEKALKKPSRAHDAEQRELTVLLRCREALESEQPLSSVLHAEEERKLVASFAFLTQKPLVGIRNVSDSKLGDKSTVAAAHVAETITLSASIEADIAQLDPADRPAFMAELGIESPARDRLIRTCYHACGLISFLTMGPDEVRAWTIPSGASTVDAAARIHTDLARSFIRAETVSFADLMAHSDMKGARAAGKVRKEGKAYIVQDGDILTILANA